MGGLRFLRFLFLSQKFVMNSVFCQTTGERDTTVHDLFAPTCSLWFILLPFLFARSFSSFFVRSSLRKRSVNGVKIKLLWFYETKIRRKCLCGRVLWRQSGLEVIKKSLLKWTTARLQKIRIFVPYFWIFEVSNFRSFFRKSHFVVSFLREFF